MSIIMLFVHRIHILIIVSTPVLIISTKDWREIVVQVGEVVPSHVNTFKKTVVKLYCGSVLPVTWFYRKYDSDEYIYLSRTRNTTNFQFQIMNNSITINNLRQSDSGLVYCDGTHIALANHTFVNYATVNVLGFVPRTRVIPNIVEVSVGDNVQLTCGTDKEAKWFGLHLNNQEKSIFNNIIILRNLKKEHSGPYVCRGIHNYRIFHSRAIIVVEGYSHLSNQLQSQLE